MDRALVIVATVVLEGPGTLGAEVIRSVSEGVDDATRIEGEEETEELATGESVEESEVLGPVVVLLTQLKLCVEREMHS